MRKYYIDNIRQTTIVLVALYHVIYMSNGIIPFGVAGPLRDVQYQDAVQYILYPWFMTLLFILSGMSARYSWNGTETVNCAGKNAEAARPVHHWPVRLPLDTGVSQHVLKQRI